MASTFSRAIHIRRCLLPLCTYQRYKAISGNKIGRNLFTIGALNMRDFLEQQETLKIKLGNFEGQFKERVDKALTEGSDIFTEDLKSLILLAKDEADIRRVMIVLNKYQSQQSREAFPSQFSQGEYMLRMFYMHKKPELAYKWFLDESNNVNGECRKVNCFMIMMDMLYKAEMYHEIVSLYSNFEDFFPEKRSTIVTIVLAALYKINTPDALTRMLSVLSDVNHLRLSSRSLFMASMMAYKHDQHGLMLELIHVPCFQGLSDSLISKADNVRMLAYTKLGRLEEVVDILKHPLQNLDKQKPIFYLDVLETVATAVEASGNLDLQTKFASLHKSLQSTNFLFKETLEDSLDLYIGIKELDHMSKSHKKKIHAWKAS